MQWLNYHHLLYFWTVAREGSITRASAHLQLAQPTVSAQLRQLEKSLGHKLFERQGRSLALTETGRLVFEYADEIFSLGRELVDVVSGEVSGRPVRFSVGVVDVMPKWITHRILAPVLDLPETVRMTCTEGALDDLLVEMAAHRLDLILSDGPVSPSSPVRVFNHLLGECPICAMAVPELAASLRRRFPDSLDGAPLLLPAPNTEVRRELDLWFETHEIQPRIVAEFQDSALIKTFGQEGAGVFFVPMAIEDIVRKLFGVRRIGLIEDITERFYAVSPERRIKHPAVAEISRRARLELFA